MKKIIQRLLSWWLPAIFVLAVGSRADAQNVCANVNTFCGARIIGGGGGGSGDLLSTNNLSDVASASTSRTNLGLAIGTNVQAYNANLASLAGLTFAADKCTYWSAAATANTMNCTTAGRSMIGAADAAAQTALLSAMVGDSGAGGTKGLVPAPGIGDSTKFLKGDGTWAAAGGGIAVGGAITSGTANRLLYEDASNLLGESSSLAVDMSGAGNGTVTFRKTLSGSATTSNFFTASGTTPTTLSAKTRGWVFNMVGDDDSQIQEAIYVEHSGTATNSETYGISVNNTHRSNNGAATGVYATGDSGAVVVGIHGQAGSGGSLGIGVNGHGGGGGGGYTNAYGVWGSSGNGTTSFGVMAARSAYSVARPLDGSGDDAALGVTNNNEAVSIARFYDNSTLVFAIGDGGNIVVGRTVTAAGTTGAQTINKAVGTVNFAAAATSIVVTNSLVSTTSIIFTTIRTADTTCTSVASTVPAAGSFTITLNAACAAETSVGFMVTN